MFDDYDTIRNMSIEDVKAKAKAFENTTNPYAVYLNQLEAIANEHNTKENCNYVIGGNN